MTYDQILNTIVPDSVIIFQEYELDRHERKHLTLEIGPVPVQQVIPPNYPLCRAELEKYYSPELTELDYCQLSCNSGIRLILRLGINEENQPIYKPILINQDFFNMGLQVINLVSAPVYGGVHYGTYYSPR